MSRAHTYTPVGPTLLYPSFPLPSHTDCSLLPSDVDVLSTSKGGTNGRLLVVVRATQVVVASVGAWSVFAKMLPAN